MEQVNNSEMAYWLAFVYSSGLKLNQLKPIAQQWYLIEGKSIAQLFNLSVAELGLRFNLTETQAQGILKAADTHKTHLAVIKNWQSQGIQLLTLNHPHYPTRLIHALPPKQQPLLLWAKGDTKGLSEPTITILGKPEPDEEIITFVNELAANLVAEGIGIVSGYGKGLDRIAFEAIIANESGFAVAMLPMGLSAFGRLTSKLNDPLAAGRTVLLSPFGPDINYKDNLAEARNVLVDSFALALLVPQVDSVSQVRAQAALARGIPVLVGMTDSPENRALIDNGAFLMTDLGEVVEMVQQAIIDNALQAELAQTPASEELPASLSLPTASSHQKASLSLLDGEDDYALGTEIVDPMAADEALDLLAAMGTVPDSLRARLIAMEQQQAKNQTGQT